MTEDTEERGKRKMAKWAFGSLIAFLVACLLLIWKGDLAEHELDALSALFLPVTMALVALIFGLKGLDTAHAQIIPAWKGKA